MMLTRSRLKQLLHYDPETGHFTARVQRGPWRIGQRVGSLRADGYRTIKIDYEDYKEHRLAWLYVYGEWPPSDLDHEERRRSENRIAHLRPATKAQNSWNCGMPRTNLTGLKGVSIEKRSGRFRARIMKDGRHYNLGLFDTAEEAHARYVSEALVLFGEFASAG